MSSAIDLTPAQRRTILRLIEGHLPNTDVWAYGSRVKWTSRPSSDLDLVAFAGPEQRSQVGDLREAFEESDLPFRVDLLVWDELPESFREEIDAEHEALVEWAANVSGLPNGWRTLSLSEAVLINPKVRIEPGELYPFVAMADVDPAVWRVRPKSKRRYNGTGSRFEVGDTLLARITPCLENGKIARYAAGDGQPTVAFGSTEFITIRGRPTVTDDTFAHYLTRSHVGGPTSLDSPRASLRWIPTGCESPREPPSGEM